MSAHAARIVRHDIARCGQADGGDCGARFEVHCSCGWWQGASSHKSADALAVGHRGYSPSAEVIITADIPQARRGK
jgi:hypothetical protein